VVGLNPAPRQYGFFTEARQAQQQTEYAEALGTHTAEGFRFTSVQ
jgi:hypothetical protein